MNFRRHRAGAALVLLLLAGWTAGCGNHRSLIAPGVPGSAEAPKLEVKAMRVAGVVPGMNRWRVTWKVTSGHADHFVVSRAPHSTSIVDDSWSVTKDMAAYVDAPARSTTLSPDRDSRAPVVHFLVRAVDAQGRLSPLGGISIVNDNLAPVVQITFPVPSDRGRVYVPPHIEITWLGNDPDGTTSTEPALYKWTLLTQNSAVPFHIALADPDSVRRYWEPRGYAGWDSTGGEFYPQPAIKYENLVPGQDYLFVVVARDGQGAWTQVMNLNSNMLNMRCTFANVGGPLLTIFNEFFFYQYPAPVYSLDPQYQIPISVTAGQAVPLNWTGTPAPGSGVRSYRWALDIEDITDETPRTNEETDLTHWSQRSLATTSAMVGPFGVNEVHFFYIEAEDLYGLKSLGVVKITTVEATFQHELLVVDDTRFFVDNRTPGQTCVNPPTNRWPSAAELDTFLYARGNTPWTCYPAGTITPAGIFSGYPFDTLGTRGLADPAISLGVLASYRHVIWLTDQNGAFKDNPPTDIANAISGLRYMSSPGRTNTLAAYVSAGGKLWVAGGGIASASMLPYNRNINDTSQPAPGITFSNAANELVPGRFPYEMGGWRSEIKVAQTPVTITRNLGRFTGRGSSYDFAPAAMRARTSLSDPYPPGRTLISGNFWFNFAGIEYLSVANHVIEDIDPTPGTDLQSTADTLYQVTGPALVQPAFNPINACMTIYRPPGGTPTVFTGFSIWDFQRVDCQALVDFVLQQQWGLTRSAPSAKRPTLNAWRASRQ